MQNLVEINDLSVVYQSENGETKAISNLSFTIKEGEFLSIVGPSGCGKSTLLSVISGLTPSTAGSVFIKGALVTKPNPLIGYMLQNDHLFEWRNILNNALLGLEVKKMKTPDTISYTKKLLTTYGLGDFLEKRPSELSGGMRQRAALIRTLATRPELLILDEAFSGLDYQTRLSVSNDIYSIIRKEKKTALMVTHDISESISLSDRVIVLSKRPAQIAGIHEIHFDQKSSPIKRREEPVFQEYFNSIWKELEVHV